MSEMLKSTIAFKSNLQIITTSDPREDRNFLASVKDPAGLEIMKKQRLPLTSVQTEEYENASLHCKYAFEGDYPYGTIVDENGKERVICKCINIECKFFPECRPDFDLDELEITEENDQLKSQIEKADISFNSDIERLDINEKSASQNGDDALSALYYSFYEKEKRPIDSGAHNIALQAEDNSKKTEQANGETSQNEEFTDASFASFSAVKQEEIIRLDPKERTIVNAGPGTGKTWTLIEKIKYMLTDYNVDPDNILVLCFSRAAVDVIRARLKESSDNGDLPSTWHMIDVRTFDSFSTYMLAWVSENIPDLLPDKYRLESQDYDSRISMAASVFRREKDMLVEYNHIIVDEVQDLVGVRAELVLSLLESLPASCGFTLLGDSCQAIYDYLSESDPNILSSDGFYRKLFHDFKNANYFTLGKNYRQDDELQKLTEPYRKAILSNNCEDSLHGADVLNSRIDTSNINLKHLTIDQASDYTSNGTLGILTRTNGQALQISTWLNNEGIEHQLLKRTDANNFAGWIYNIISCAETDVIDKDEFYSIFHDKYPKYMKEIGQYWNALTGTQRDSTKNYYEIEDLLHGLMRNPGNSFLFREPDEEIESDIIVSTIHRAKGREFDSVILTDDILPRMDDAQNNNFEHKVCYVAVTRSKRNLQKASIDEQDKYIRIMKDESRRCFRSGRSKFRKKLYLSNFEVGVTSDFDIRSFAADKETQIKIQEYAKRGEEILLIKCPKDTRDYYLYKIVPVDYPTIVLGYTSEEFFHSIEEAIHCIYNSYSPVKYEYLPEKFGSVYSEGLKTCISTDSKGLKGALQFDDIYMWNSIAMHGFAKSERYSY